MEMIKTKVTIEINGKSNTLAVHIPKGNKLLDSLVTNQELEAMYLKTIKDGENCKE